MSEQRAIFIKCQGDIFRVEASWGGVLDAASQYPGWVKGSKIKDEIARDHLTFFTHFLHLKQIASYRVLKPDQIFDFHWGTIEDEL